MRTFCNPILLDCERPDPFIARFEGRYYLWATHPQLLCHSSLNLIDWQSEGPTVEAGTFADLVPFAPEVIRYAGTYYLYTSPSGTGHWVLASEKPTGPFRVVKKDLARHLDGSPFVDDDGQLYFYWADDRGIMGCRMLDPVTPDQDLLVHPTTIGWTEGPQIIKEEGLYYLTYCGNHFLSKGYRIYCAVAASPLGPFAPVQEGPLLVHTEGSSVGLGHCSTVKAPDLTYHYLCYHNLNADRSRDLNLIPIFFSDGAVQLLDYRIDEQPAPLLPTYGSELMAGSLPIEWEASPLSPGMRRSKTRFTLDSAVVEAIIVAHTLPFIIHAGPLRLECRSADAFLLSSDEGSTTCRLPHPLTLGSAHSLLLETDLSILSLTFDAMVVARIPMGALTPAPIECSADLEVLHLQVTEARPTRPLSTMVRPLPIARAQNGPSYLAASTGGSYLFHRFVRDASGVHIEGSVHRLKKGVQRCPIETARLVIHPKAPRRVYAKKFSPRGSYGKYLFGSPWMSSTRIEAVIRRNQLAAGGSFGLVFRATESSEGGEGRDRVLGIDFFLGYSLMISSNTIILSKHRYDRETLAACSHSLPLGRPIKITVAVEGNHITAIVDGQYELHYDDEADPLLYGRVGLRLEAALVDWADITVACND